MRIGVQVDLKVKGMIHAITSLEGERGKGIERHFFTLVLILLLFPFP
jgi:hypothetical protein